MIKIIFLILMTTLCGSGLAAVFGDGNPYNGIEDQRRQAPAEMLKSVGTIYCDGALRGSATHVYTATKTHPSVIVTAAHVLYNRVDGQAFKDCSYRPQNKRLTAIPFAEVDRHGYQPLSKNRLHQSENDVAFVALKYRLYAPSMSLSIESSSKDELSLVAYNGSADAMHLAENCMRFSSISFGSEHLILHNCDAQAGASGGALLDRSHKNVIAVHGGTFFVRPQTVNGSSNAINVAPAGSRANPESWINHARKVDQPMINQLRYFVAYLAKDSSGQTQSLGQIPEY
jgi:hypothetical protein